MILELADGGYDTVIRQIDYNMDALNTVKADYENQILNNIPIIGGLASEINSLWTKIVNWVN
jgi:uncharacterized protein YqhQ